MGVPATSGSCPHCGGTEVSHGLELNQNAEAGTIGLSYKAVGIFRGTEALWADLCRSCGTVIRFYVKKTDRKWIETT